jgi:hypothetical protein
LGLRIPGVTIGCATSFTSGRGFRCACSLTWCAPATASTTRGCACPAMPTSPTRRSKVAWHPRSANCCDAHQPMPGGTHSHRHRHASTRHTHTHVPDAHHMHPH